MTLTYRAAVNSRYTIYISGSELTVEVDVEVNIDGTYRLGLVVPTAYTDLTLDGEDSGSGTPSSPAIYEFTTMSGRATVEVDITVTGTGLRYVDVHLLPAMSDSLSDSLGYSSIWLDSNAMRRDIDIIGGAPIALTDLETIELYVYGPVAQRPVFRLNEAEITAVLRGIPTTEDYRLRKAAAQCCLLQAQYSVGTGNPDQAEDFRMRAAELSPVGSYV